MMWMDWAVKMKGQILEANDSADAQAYSSLGHPSNMSQNHGYQTLKVRQIV